MLTPAEVKKIMIDSLKGEEQRSYFPPRIRDQIPSEFNEFSTLAIIIDHMACAVAEELYKKTHDT